MTDHQRPEVTRLHLLPDNDKESRSGSKRPSLPGRNRSGSGGSGNRGDRVIPPWVIAVLFLGLVAYQLYAIFDPQRDTRSITVPYSVVVQEVKAGNVNGATISDTTIDAELKSPVAWDRQSEQLVTPTAGAQPASVSEGDHFRATLPPIENTAPPEPSGPVQRHRQGRDRQLIVAVDNPGDVAPVLAHRRSHRLYGPADEPRPAKRLRVRALARAPT